MIAVASRLLPTPSWIARLTRSAREWLDLLRLARELDGRSAWEARKLLEERGLLTRLESEAPPSSADPARHEVQPASNIGRRSSLDLRRRLWPMYRRVERQSRLFGEMLDRVSVDPLLAARHGMGSGFATAAQRCLTCSKSVACQAWLDRGHTGGAPSFCPNAEFLNRLRSRAVHHAAV